MGYGYDKRVRLERFVCGVQETGVREMSDTPRGGIMKMARIQVDGMDKWDIPKFAVPFAKWWHSIFGEKITIISTWEA